MIRYILTVMMMLLLIGCQPAAVNTPLPPSATALPLSATHTVNSPDPSVTPAVSNNYALKIDEFQSFLEKRAESDNLSGTVLVAKDGKTVLHEAYGMADRDKAIPNNLDTKYNLGSMDKMFTGVAIMQLVEQGKLSLDAKAGEYLPDYPNREVIDAVTIHQLLTHTSGMGDCFNNTEAYLDIHDEIRSISDNLPLFVDTPLLFQPGSKFRYSNSGYVVLGLVIEAVSGESYYDYVRNHIFEPAGMKDTASYELDAGIPNMAIGYTTRDVEGNETGVLTDNSWVIPMRGSSAGGGYSTANDLLSFANALMAYRLLSEESTTLLLKGKVEREENFDYAYGFYDRMVNSHRMVGHGGGMEGVCSFLNIYPELGYMFIVLSNSDSDCRPELLDYMETNLLDEKSNQ